MASSGLVLLGEVGQVASAPPILYVLVFFALLIAAAIGFALVARRSFAEAEQREMDELRRAEPRRRREADHRARGQRRQRLWLAMRASGLHELPGSLDEPMRALHRLHEMLGQAPDWEARLPGGDMLEITDRAERLYDVALGQVERVIHLSELASSVDAGPRGDMRQRLEEVQRDLADTVRTLAAALDQLHASAVGGGFDPSIQQRLRDDIDARLHVAARVERRMSELG